MKDKLKTFLLYFFAVALTVIAVTMTIESEIYDKNHPTTEKSCSVTIYDKERITIYKHTKNVLYFRNDSGHKGGITVSNNIYQKHSIGDVIIVKYEERDGRTIPNSYEYEKSAE